MAKLETLRINDIQGSLSLGEDVSLLVEETTGQMRIEAVNIEYLDDSPRVVAAFAAKALFSTAHMRGRWNKSKSDGEITLRYREDT